MSSEMERKTDDLLTKVHDRDSFIAFLAQLRDDWEDSMRQHRENPSLPYDPGANGWRNGDIGAFLDAAHARAETCAKRADEGFPEPILPSEPSWRGFAGILLAGKLYE